MYDMQLTKEDKEYLRSLMEQGKTDYEIRNEHFEGMGSKQTRYYREKWDLYPGDTRDTDDTTRESDELLDDKKDEVVPEQETNFEQKKPEPEPEPEPKTHTCDNCDTDFEGRPQHCPGCGGKFVWE